LDFYYPIVGQWESYTKEFFQKKVNTYNQEEEEEEAKK